MSMNRKRGSELEYIYYLEGLGCANCAAKMEAGINKHKDVKSANVAKRAGYTFESRAKEATYHYTGLHDLDTYVKISPYPIVGF